MADPASIRALFDLVVEMTNAESIEDVVETLSTTGAATVGASGAAIGVAVDGLDAVRIYRGPMSDGWAMRRRIVDVNAASPVTDSIRTNSSVLMASELEFHTRYPAVSKALLPGEITALASHPLRADDGELLGAFAFRFSNGATITEQSEAVMQAILSPLARTIVGIERRAELAARTERLQQSNADLENFAAVVAHDLSAPVRRIGSFLQLLEGSLAQTLDEKQTRYFTTVQDQVRHLDALLRDTLSYSAIADRSRSHAPVSLDDVAQDVVSPMSDELREADAQVRLHELPQVVGERSMIQQIVQNLIDNALKYRQLDRPLTIEISAAEGSYSQADLQQWWKIMVSDNGIGIEPERRTEVFGMFARLEASDDRPGTGVGLAFAKRAIELHGGEIGVDDGIDGGSCLWFTLPGVRSLDHL